MKRCNGCDEEINEALFYATLTIYHPNGENRTVYYGSIFCLAIDTGTALVEGEIEAEKRRRIANAN